MVGFRLGIFEISHAGIVDIWTSEGTLLLRLALRVLVDGRSSIMSDLA